MSAGRAGIVRGGVLAAFCALLTVIGHVAGGGGLPDPAVLVVVLPPLTVVTIRLAERARGLAGTVAVLGGGQLALHLTLLALHPMADMGGPDTGTMLGAHGVVTVVVATAVRHADRALAVVAAAVARVRPRRPLPLPADRPLPARPLPADDPPTRLARSLAVADLRRGPPVR